MRHQKSPNRWSCLPTSFAMVLNQPVEQLIEQLGHDGSSICWPNQPEPLCRRGFHIQELTDYMFKQGMYVIPFQACPTYRPVDSESIVEAQTKLTPTQRMAMAMAYEAVIIGQTNTGASHAIAWNGKKVFDPGEMVIDIKEFYIDTVYSVIG